MLGGMARFQGEFTFLFDVPSFEDAPAKIHRLNEAARQAGFEPAGGRWESVAPW
jgi:hypothetical protein